MRITRIDDLHADAGWRNVSFVRMATDEGSVGWSEYRADAGNAGVTGVIGELEKTLPALLRLKPRFGGHHGASLAGGRQPRARDRLALPKTLISRV
jgi:hypothetical protein